MGMDREDTGQTILVPYSNTLQESKVATQNPLWRFQWENQIQKEHVHTCSIVMFDSQSDFDLGLGGRSPKSAAVS